MSSNAMTNLEWHRMLSRSFSPQQWFVADEWPEPDGNETSYDKERKMYVYRRNGDGTYTVGYYDPGGEWHSESTWESAKDASARVRWLHGGN